MSEKLRFYNWFVDYYNIPKSKYANNVIDQTLLKQAIDLKEQEDIQRGIETNWFIGTPMIDEIKLICVELSDKLATAYKNKVEEA